MHDMIVRLYALPSLDVAAYGLEERGIRIRRCMPYELLTLQSWVAANFSPKWVSEATIAMSRAMLLSSVLCVSMLPCAVS